jgi:hypothetical protein
MQPTGKPELVSPSIGLFFGEDPPDRIPLMLRLGRQNIDIAAGEADYVVADSFVLPVDVEVQAVQPHAHHRARHITGTAFLPDGTSRSLIDIPDWDFRWQHVYRYVSPVALPKGTTIAMRYSYDNSAANVRNPQQPPLRVMWGQWSRDEMGDLWIQVLTRNEQDRQQLNAAFRPKAIAEDAIGYEQMIRIDPARASLHDDVAVLYLELNRPREAAAHFAATVGLKPDSAPAHYNLATALTLSGGSTRHATSIFARSRSGPDTRWRTTTSATCSAPGERGRRAAAFPRGDRARSRTRRRISTSAASPRRAATLRAPPVSFARRCGSRPTGSRPSSVSPVSCSLLPIRRSGTRRKRSVSRNGRPT